MSTTHVRCIAPNRTCPKSQETSNWSLQKCILIRSVEPDPMFTCFLHAMFRCFALCAVWIRRLRRLFAASRSSCRAKGREADAVCSCSHRCCFRPVPQCPLRFCLPRGLPPPSSRSIFSATPLSQGTSLLCRSHRGLGPPLRLYTLSVAPPSNQHADRKRRIAR